MAEIRISLEKMFGVDKCPFFMNAGALDIKERGYVTDEEWRLRTYIQGVKLFRKRTQKGFFNRLLNIPAVLSRKEIEKALLDIGAVVTEEEAKEAFPQLIGTDLNFAIGEWVYVQKVNDEKGNEKYRIGVGFVDI